MSASSSVVFCRSIENGRPKVLVHRLRVVVGDVDAGLRGDDAEHVLDRRALEVQVHLRGRAELRHDRDLVDLFADLLDVRLRLVRLELIADLLVELLRLAGGHDIRRIDVGGQTVFGGGTGELLLRFEVVRALDVRRRGLLHRVLEGNLDVHARRILPERIAIVGDRRVPVALVSGGASPRECPAGGTPGQQHHGQ